MADKFKTNIRITDQQLYEKLVVTARTEGRSITKQLEHELRKVLA